MILVVGLAMLAGRAAYLQLIADDRLQDEGMARFVRNQTIAANRGIIRDRNGQTLAISTPVDSVLAVPDIVKFQSERFPELAAAIDIGHSELRRAIDRGIDRGREGILLKRQISPSESEAIEELDIPGVSLIREYRRFYPYGSKTSSVLGLTSIDDIGLEGVELALNDQLEGVSGLNRVINDRHGRTVEAIASLRNVQDGDDVQLSIDIRVQQILYERLIQALDDSKAAHAVGVVADPKTGEILAIATAPSFNPHSRKGHTVRNRAVTDVFEPGSIIKPFLVAKALEDGIVKPGTMIDTSPGEIKIDGYRVEDIRNFGTLDVSDVIMRSSNVGVIKIAMNIDPNEILDFYQRFGFGSRTQNVMPGEQAGRMPDRDRWRISEHASLSYGYGFSVSALQAIQAYSVFANDGLLKPLTLLKGANDGQAGSRVIDAELAQTVSSMLERTSLVTGTARRAKMPLYRVAGKTATVQKLIDGKYSSDNHLVFYVGYAPVSDPRLAAIIVVDDPQAGEHYGGLVAAPVFRDVVSESLRLLNEPYDDLPKLASSI